MASPSTDTPRRLWNASPRAPIGLYRLAVHRLADAALQPLPHRRGCISLASHPRFALPVAPDSVDSRYFGPLDLVHVRGTVHPVWTTSMSGHQSVQQRARAPP
jgi:type IV secretory pathway protease TraF